MSTDLFGNEITPVAPPAPPPPRIPPAPDSIEWDRMVLAGKHPVTGTGLIGSGSACGGCVRFDGTVQNAWAVGRAGAGQCRAALGPTIRAAPACTLYAYGDTDLDGPGKVGRHHPTTSKRSATIRFGSQRWRALELIYAADEGLTAYAVGRGLGISPNQAATRLGELREAGLIRYVVPSDGIDDERETTPGSTGKVHLITEAGDVVLRSGRPAT